jgi:CheY-like chemotaxis protein
LKSQISEKNIILLVDDDEGIRDALTSLLDMEGYSVMTAEDGEQALEILKTLKPTLIILDERMPVMGGWEFLDARKANPHFSEIPVLLFGAGNEFARPPGLNVQGFVKKPINIEDLLAAVHSMSKT